MSIIGKKKKTFDTIVAPLSKIETQLGAYVQEQERNVVNLEDQRRKIEDNIKTAKTEKAKSQHTITKISELLGSDFDGIIDEDAESETVTDEPKQPE